MKSPVQDQTDVEAGALLPVNDLRRQENEARSTLKDLLLSEVGRGDLVLPRRGGRAGGGVRLLPED